MPPIRRYLRITKYSVLECRIYLDNPADAQRWLLNPRAPVLPRVVEAVRPLVLPKLREENARAKSGKRRGWRDVVREDDFEVAVFLTETSSRHSILRKEKRAKSEAVSRLGTVGGKMTGSRDAPVEVGEEAPGLLREEDSEEKMRMADLASATEEWGSSLAKEDSGEGLFVSDGEDEQETAAHKRDKEPSFGQGEEGDDKKKMLLNTTYDGFSIYGRILCLVVKRRGTAKGKEFVGGAGQAMMEEWIASTQMAEGQMMDE